MVFVINSLLLSHFKERSTFIKGRRRLSTYSFSSKRNMESEEIAHLTVLSLVLFRVLKKNSRKTLKKKMGAKYFGLKS